MSIEELAQDYMNWRREQLEWQSTMQSTVPGLSAHVSFEAYLLSKLSPTNQSRKEL